MYNNQTLGKQMNLYRLFAYVHRDNMFIFIFWSLKNVYVQKCTCVNELKQGLGV